MPVWYKTINLADVFHNDALTYEAKRDEIVKRVRESGWFTEYDYDLVDLVNMLAEAPTENDFDYFWNELYDYADLDRVWIETT